MPYKPKLYFVFLVLIISTLLGNSSFGQDYPEYDELALFLDVPKVGGRDMDVIIKGSEVYLPITDLFDFLMIRNVPKSDLDTISGFFIDQDAPYLIDRINQQILYNGELYQLKPGDLIRTETNLYLRGKYFGEIFGLESEFNFRALSVKINTRLELPAIREMRLQAMRKNIKRLVGEEEADTTIERRYPFFQFGMADWSANVSEDLDGQVDSRLGLALGSMLAGGEATVVLNYNSYAPFTEKQQHYLWRYVNNENKAFRQVMAGKIATGATSSIFDPVVGAKITNASTKFRRSFGTYTLSDYTEPNWIVELYVNNVLVDFTTADASGFYIFEVPLVYGNTNVMLKFYGPYGEERTQEQNITIPFNFVPHKTVEYSVSGGMVEDNQRSTFSRSHVYYGLTRSITIGSGVEYLSSVTSGQFMPFVNGSFRLASNLLLSGEFSPEVRSKGTLTYRLPSSLQFDVNYVYYKKGQTAINNIFKEERKVSVSMPIRLKNFSVYNRLSVNQLVLPSTNYTTSEWLISGALFGINTNITTYGVFVGKSNPYFYTDFGMSFRLPKDISLQPRAQYSYTNEEFLSAKILAEKRVLRRGYLTASYEQNFRSNMHLLEFGFRYDFSFAQTSFMARQTDRSTQFIQFARGSIVNDGKNNYVYTDYRSNVGRGAISITPFLDVNANGKRDQGEPKVWGLNIRANGGRIEKREADTTVRIFGLEPYSECFVEFDQSSLDNIAWRLKHRSMNIEVDPNIVKQIEIPISVVGEAAGMVRIDHRGGIRGLGRIIVNFYDKNQNKIGRTLSEADGYFSYFGLKPGTYDAILDSAQLNKLQMVASPAFVNFKIAANIDGDYVDGLDFLVKIDTLKPIEPKIPDLIVHEETREGLIGTRDGYTLEFGEFEDEAEARAMEAQLRSLTGKEVTTVAEGDQYKLYISGISTKVAAEQLYPLLQSKGISEIGLIAPSTMIEPRMLAIMPGIETDTVISVTENDTAIMLVNKVVYEDSEIFPDNFAIEISIEDETEARELEAQLRSLTGKEVTTVADGDQYKLHIAGISTKVAAEQLYPLLHSKGINKIGLKAPPDMIKSRMLAIMPGVETDTVISVSENDTAIMLVHKIAYEETETLPDNFEIVIASIEDEAEARALEAQLRTLTGNEVTVIPTGDQYKIQISGIETKVKVEGIYPLLQANGIKEIGLITPPSMIESRMLAIMPGVETDTVISIFENDTTIMLVEKVEYEYISTLTEDYAIEIAIEDESQARAMEAQLRSLTGKEVTTVAEGDQYKLYISGISTKVAAEQLYPLLQSKGISEIGLIAPSSMIEPRMLAIMPGIETDTVISIVEKDTAVMLVNKVAYEDTEMFPENFAIEIAIEDEAEARAMEAQLRSLTGKEVTTVAEGDQFKLYISGISTKVAAEQLYPLLQSKGISEIGLIAPSTMIEPRMLAIMPGVETDTVISIVEKDTSVMLVNKVAYEDSEMFPENFAIEIAIEDEAEARAMEAQLRSLTGKEVTTVAEGDQYKLYISGISTKVAAEQLYPLLQSKGISEIGLIAPSTMIEPRMLAIMPGIETDTVISVTENDTAIMLVNKVVYEDSEIFPDNFAIEIAIEDETEARELEAQLRSLTGKEVTTVADGDQYKLHIAGISTKVAAEQLYPLLHSKGINKIGLKAPPDMIKSRMLAIMPGVETDTVISVSENDTAIMLVHKIAYEETETLPDNFEIVIASIEDEAEARALEAQLRTLTGNEVTVIPTGDQYKIQISGIETKVKVEGIYPLLQANGIKEIGLITPPSMIESRMLAIMPGVETDTVISIFENDTTIMLVEKVEYEYISTLTEDYAIEIAIEDESQARAMEAQLRSLTGKEVTTVAEGDQFKLYISGISTKVAAEQLYPLLQSKGISEIGLVSKPGSITPVIATTITPPIETTPVKTYNDQDTTSIIIHSIIKEDSTSSIDRYAIQIGAFKRKANAFGLREKLAGMVDQEVTLTIEDEFHKVRIVGFNSNYEVERYIPTIVNQGIREIWVITLKGTRKPDLIAGEPDIHRDILDTFTAKDTTYAIIHDVYEEILTTGPDSYTIQLGAFNRKINADALRSKLKAITGNEVQIFVENELYKVRIIGFATRNEAEKYVPELIKEGVSEINILPLEGEQEYRTAVSVMDTITGAQLEEPAQETRQLTRKEEIKEVSKPVPDTPIAVEKPVTSETQEEVLATKPTSKAIEEETKGGEMYVRGDNTEKQPEYERRKTLEERLLEAEYRSGLYDSRWPGVEFTIQIAASKTIGDPEIIKKKFDLSGDVEVEKVDEWYRFTTGHFIKYWKAREYRNILNTRNELNDAFIVAYKDGKKTMLYDLLAIAESMPEAEEPAANIRQPLPKAFSVQILATKDGKISDSDIRKMYDIDEDIFKEYSESDGLYRYSFGNFNTYTAAVKVRNKLRAKGFRDAFVVGFRNGKRVKDLKSIL